MNTWEKAIIGSLKAHYISDFILERTPTFSVKISAVFHNIKTADLIKVTVWVDYGELLGEYNDSMQILLFNVCEEIRSELYRQIQYHNEKHVLNLQLTDYLDLNISTNDSTDTISNNRIKRSEIVAAATKWVFDTNGNKWSNNNSECGDNFGSFLEGVKFAVEHLGMKIIEDDPE